MLQHLWTADNNKRQIFTARLRMLETAVPTANNDESVKTDILLEDPTNGQLFATASYTVTAVVEQVLDSSRFFAIRVQGEGGRKAVLGIGFEERSEALDLVLPCKRFRRTLRDQQPCEGGREEDREGGRESPREERLQPEGR